MNLTKLLGDRSLRKLVANPRGRSFLLAFMADAEESDEVGLFDALDRKVDDPKLHAMVQRHTADEERHAAMLRAEVARIGVAVEPLPDTLRYVLRVGGMLGGWAEDFVAGRIGVMEAYVLLGLIEERAVREWPAIVAALDTVDPQAARVVAAIIEDEKRHVRYSHAIARRYAPDDETLARTEARYRAVEEKAYAAHAQAFLTHALDRDLFAVGRIEKQLWRWIAAVPPAAELRWHTA